MDEYQEILKSLEGMREGQWVPITILSMCFTVIISLLLYIWNKTQKSNDERHRISEQRHDKTSEILDKVSDAHRQNAELLGRLDERTGFLEKMTMK